MSIQAYYDNKLHLLLERNHIKWHKLHRDGDKPAVILDHRERHWYKHGLRHRDTRIVNGVLVDEPAMIWNDGSKFWYNHGLAHRDGDLPAKMWKNGTNFWWKNGKYYYNMNLQKLYQLQFLLILLFNIQKNKQQFHPECFLGKLIKKDLFELFK